MFMIYCINMQSLTQTNVFLAPVLRSHLRGTNVLVCLNLQSSGCDASPAKNPNAATFSPSCAVVLNITLKAQRVRSSSI